MRRIHEAILGDTKRRVCKRRAIANAVFVLEVFANAVFATAVLVNAMRLCLQTPVCLRQTPQRLCLQTQEEQIVCMHP